MRSESPQRRARPAFFAVLLAASLLPAFTHCQVGGELAAVAAVLALLALVSPLRSGLVVAAGWVVYVIFGHATTLPVPLVVGLWALLCVLVARSAWLWVSFGVVSSLVVCAATLSAWSTRGLGLGGLGSGVAPETLPGMVGIGQNSFEGLWLRLCGGLVIGALAALAADRATRKSPRWRRNIAGLVLVAAVGLVMPAPLATPRLGVGSDWRDSAGTGRPVAGVEVAAAPTLERFTRSGSAFALERRRAAGDADAALLWVAVALSQNATPARLRRGCPRGSRSVPDGPWRGWGQQARRACEALVGLPEAGARLLAGERDPALQRLRADLWLAAGLLAEARAAYRVAAEAGDPFARRDGVRGLLDRGRPVAAAALASPSDPLTTLWLEPDRDGPELWVAWNRAMDSVLSSLTDPSRVGIRSLDAPGQPLALLDPQLGKRVLVTRTRYATRFALSLPSPPARRLPASVRLRARNRRGFELTLTTTAGGRLTYTCDPFLARPGETVLTLPGSICGGAWGDTDLRPGDALAGDRINGFELRGDFALAKLEIRAP